MATLMNGVVNEAGFAKILWNWNVNNKIKEFLQPTYYVLLSSEFYEPAWW